MSRLSIKEALQGKLLQPKVLDRDRSTTPIDVLSHSFNDISDQGCSTNSNSQKSDALIEPSTLAPTQGSFQIDKCPPPRSPSFTVFDGSKCLTNELGGAFSLFCKNGKSKWPVITDGNCPDTHHCFTFPATNDQPFPIALCLRNKD